MKMYFGKSLFLVFVILLIAPVISSGNLGDSLSKAKSRASLYKAKYGAVAPMFKTDDNGKIVWECWAAPPREWTEKEAMEFAMKLLPLSLRNETPRKGSKDGTYYPYTFSDGTMIILQGFRGSYIGVEVRAPGYDGPRC